MRQVSPLHHSDATCSKDFLPTKAPIPLTVSSGGPVADSEMLCLEQLTACAEKLHPGKLLVHHCVKAVIAMTHFQMLARMKVHHLSKETQRHKRAAWLSADHRLRMTLLQFIPSIHLYKPLVQTAHNSTSSIPAVPLSHDITSNVTPHQPASKHWQHLTWQEVSICKHPLLQFPHIQH